MIFTCEKCNKNYSSASSLTKHNITSKCAKNQSCNSSSNELPVKKNSFDILNHKIDHLTNIVNNQSQQITMLINIISNNNQFDIIHNSSSVASIEPIPQISPISPPIQIQVKKIKYKYVLPLEEPIEEVKELIEEPVKITQVNKYEGWSKQQLDDDAENNRRMMLQHFHNKPSEKEEIVEEEPLAEPFEDYTEKPKTYNSFFDKIKNDCNKLELKPITKRNKIVKYFRKVKYIVAGKGYLTLLTKADVKLINRDVELYVVTNNIKDTETMTAKTKVRKIIFADIVNCILKFIPNIDDGLNVEDKYILTNAHLDKEDMDRIRKYGLEIYNQIEQQLIPEPPTYRLK